LRGEEVGLAQAEVEDVDPLGLQLPGLGARGQGGRGLHGGRHFRDREHTLAPSPGRGAPSAPRVVSIVSDRSPPASAVPQRAGPRRVAHFAPRSPPALGGSEAYFARLSAYLAGRGDAVTVFTTTAVDLEAFWSVSGKCVRPGRAWQDGVEVRRHHLWHL